MTCKHIDSFESELKRVYPEFSTYPIEVKFALFDIIFNVGMTDLNTRWPSLKKAVKARDWIQASTESSRKPPISEERNRYVRELFEKGCIIEKT